MGPSGSWLQSRHAEVNHSLLEVFIELGELSLGRGLLWSLFRDASLHSLRDIGEYESESPGAT